MGTLIVGLLIRGLNPIAIFRELSQELPQRSSWRVLYILGLSPLQLSFHLADYLPAHEYWLDISQLGSIGLLRGLYIWVTGPASPGSLTSVTKLDSNALWTEARLVHDWDDISGPPL